MGTKLNFNATTRRFECLGPTVNGRFEINLQVDLYSDAKEDWQRRHLLLPGAASHNVTTPDAADLDIVGDIDLRVEAALDDWTPGALTHLISKYRASAGARSYRLHITAGNNLTLQWSEDGSSTLQEQVAVPVGWGDGSRRWVRAILDVDNGSSDAEVRFYESFGGVSWTQVGATQLVGATTSVYAGTEQVSVGTNGAGGEPASGQFYSAQIFNGIDGTLVADFNANDFEAQDTDADTAVDSVGKTWTINGGSSVIEGSDLANMQFPINAIGGQPWPTGQIGISYEILYGWSFEPLEEDHTMVLIGNIASQNNAWELVEDTVGSYRVRIENQVSSLVEIRNNEITEVIEIREGVYGKKWLVDAVDPDADPGYMVLFEVDNTIIGHKEIYEAHTDVGDAANKGYTRTGRGIAWEGPLVPDVLPP